jgi:hypothetical protein
MRCMALYAWTHWTRLWLCLVIVFPSESLSFGLGSMGCQPVVYYKFKRYVVFKRYRLVVVCVRSNHVHLDVRQYPYIKWLIR